MQNYKNIHKMHSSKLNTYFLVKWCHKFAILPRIVDAGREACFFEETVTGIDRAQFGGVDFELDELRRPLHFIQMEVLVLALTRH